MDDGGSIPLWGTRSTNQPKEKTMFGRKEVVVQDDLARAQAAAHSALSLFNQAKIGLQDANEVLANVIDAATNEIQTQRERVSAAQGAQSKNDSVITALTNLVGE
jgi:F0F1-type ATP synthase membrane subunit b/b'